jgi:hypothetical protein
MKTEKCEQTFKGKEATTWLLNEGTWWINDHFRRVKIYYNEKHVPRWCIVYHKGTDRCEVKFDHRDLREIYFSLIEASRKREVCIRISLPILVIELNQRPMKVGSNTFDIWDYFPTGPNHTESLSVRVNPEAQGWLSVATQKPDDAGM